VSENFSKLPEKREFWEKVSNKDFSQRKISIYFSWLNSSFTG